MFNNNKERPATGQLHMLCLLESDICCFTDSNRSEQDNRNTILWDDSGPHTDLHSYYYYNCRIQKKTLFSHLYHSLTPLFIGNKDWCELYKTCQYILLIRKKYASTC
jgi:hypothetical protein